VKQTATSRGRARVAPEFVQLAAHPVRWQLLQELIASDRAVSELTRLTGAPQNLVSYHLGRLRNGGLVSARRSSNDGRDRYYTIDLERCREQLQATGGALHPALALVPSGRAPAARAGRTPRVLFLCTGNSARSQMAQALLERLSGGAVRAASAGSNPKPLHRNAVRAMKRRGIDISGNRTKHYTELDTQRFDVVITLCDKVREVCPEFPFHPRVVHWSIGDPALAGPTDTASYPAFEATATELESRIGFLLYDLNNEHQTNSRNKPATRRPTNAGL
jgi:protein-tyrosine-phosphatase/DNA-binding transcriptional ArsR family regulator